MIHRALHDVSDNTAEPVKAGVAFALGMPDHRDCAWGDAHGYRTGRQAKHFGPLACRRLGYGRDDSRASQNQRQRGEALGTVWGDSATGAHGSFLRLPKGFISPAHVHSGDYYGVIVQGSVSNAEPGQQKVVLEPGSYYFQKGNAEHVTKCIGDTDCLIYISQSKAFDFIPSTSNRHGRHQ